MYWQCPAVLQAHWMMMRHLGGWLLWALSLDDFSGSVCNEGKCPLLKAVSNTIDVTSATNEIPQ